MTRIPAWLSGVVLVVVMALGVGYLTLGVLRIDPTVQRNQVQVRMDEAAGLRPGSTVVYRGVDIGAVDRVESVPGGVLVRLSYDRSYRIPADSAMKVENLSALGEPVFAFLPGSGVGKDKESYLADGARLVGRVEAPTSVPQLLAASSNLLSQADSETVARLVATFSDTIDHAAELTPTIARAAELLTLTLLRHQPSLEALLRNLMQLMPDVDWVKPVLTSAPPQLDAFGNTLGVSYQYLFEGSALLRGREVLGSWREEEQQFVDFLSRLAPELGGLGVALRPASSAAGPALGAIDLATLLDQALTTLPGDRLRVALTVPSASAAQGNQGER